MLIIFLGEELNIVVHSLLKILFFEIMQFQEVNFDLTCLKNSNSADIQFVYVTLYVIALHTNCLFLPQGLILIYSSAYSYHKQSQRTGRATMGFAPSWA